MLRPQEPSIAGRLQSALSRPAIEGFRVFVSEWGVAVPIRLLENTRPRFRGRTPAMNLHEYQSKDVFRSFGIPVPSGKVATTVDEAAAAAEALGGPVWVVKAQVHAGGRGKAGGVKVVKDIAAVRKAAESMLGQTLVTKQTGPEGLPINSVYVESGSDIEREIYLSLTLNREKGRVAVIASAAGGMDIEEVAAHTPEKILAVNIDPAAGLQPYQCRKLAFGLGLSGKQIGEFQSIVTALAEAL